MRSLGLQMVMSSGIQVLTKENAHFYRPKLKPKDDDRPSLGLLISALESQPWRSRNETMQRTRPLTAALSSPVKKVSTPSLPQRARPQSAVGKLLSTTTTTVVGPSISGLGANTAGQNHEQNFTATAKISPVRLT